jgi:hypothetical protein
MTKALSYLILAALAVVVVGCDNKNNRSAAIRNPYTGPQSGYSFNQPFYQNCGQTNYQYTNPMNNTAMTCQYQNGMPQFYNQYNQPYMTDRWGYPCWSGQVDPYSGYCMDQSAYNYYPQYGYM